jgi:hypothetical protein
MLLSGALSEALDTQNSSSFVDERKEVSCTRLNQSAHKIYLDLMVMM